MIIFGKDTTVAWKTFREKAAGARKSWTIWVNAVAATVIVAIPVVQESLPQLQSYIPDGIYRLLSMVIIVANIILRIKTVVGLENK